MKQSYSLLVTFYFWDSILNFEAKFKPYSKIKSHPEDIISDVSGGCDNKSIGLVIVVVDSRNKNITEIKS